MGTPTPNHWTARGVLIVSFLMQLVKMRSYESEWAQCQYDACQTHREAHRKNIQRGGCRDGSDVSTSQGIQGRGMEPILLLSLQKGPSLPTPGSQTSDFRSCTRVSFLFYSTQFVPLCYDCARKSTQALNEASSSEQVHSGMCCARS